MMMNVSLMVIVFAAIAFLLPPCGPTVQTACPRRKKGRGIDGD